MSKISFIIPCYFNEKNIPVTKKRLLEVEGQFGEDTTFEYIFIDDGSKDKTLEELLKFHQECPKKVKVLKLARNFGAVDADWAGIHHATGDCCVILACDMQDPPELVPKMFNYWQKGNKVVIANRRDRQEGNFAIFFSKLFHILIKKFALKNIPNGGFDLVLFDAQIREDLKKVTEKNTNIQYLISWLGYDYVNIPYVRQKREIGKSGWTFSKKLKYFIDSFMAFTFFPIRLVSIIGLFFGLTGLLYGMYIFIFHIFYSNPVRGWNSLMLVTLFVGAFQMVSIGILGEYVWRVLDETRKRPNYIIDEIWDKTKEEK